MARERSGLHFYMPSPVCLAKDGAIELKKLHLAINVDKFLEGINVSGSCMKYNVKYAVDTLLTYPTLSQRGFDIGAPQISGFATAISGPPVMPGICLNIREVYESDKDHPLLHYLRSRNFTNYPRMLNQFRLSYCIEPHATFLPIKFPLTQSPAGRAIFFVEEFGDIVGWQGRLLEMEKDGAIYIWDYVKKLWKPIYTKDASGEKVARAPYDKIQPVRYYLPPRSAPSAHLLGYDAARRFNEGKATKWIGIAEGPFDIARIGPPFCATMSKYFNDQRAKLVARAGFDLVVVVCDNDTKSKNKGAGDVLWTTTSHHVTATHNIRTVRVHLPDGRKDLGECTEVEAVTLINNCLLQHGVGRDALLKASK